MKCLKPLTNREGTPQPENIRTGYGQIEHLLRPPLSSKANTNQFVETTDCGLKVKIDVPTSHSLQEHLEGTTEAESTKLLANKPNPDKTELPCPILREFSFPPTKLVTLYLITPKFPFPSVFGNFRVGTGNGR